MDFERFCTERESAHGDNRRPPFLHIGLAAVLSVQRTDGESRCFSNDPSHSQTLLSIEYKNNMQNDLNSYLCCFRSSRKNIGKKK